MQVRILELDGGLDPDEYCKERGAAAYQERLDGAKGYFHWLADRARTKYDVRTTEGQVSVLKFLMPAVQRISDRMERMVVAGDVASYVGIDRGMVLDSFKKSVAERQEKHFAPPRAVLRHDERILVNAMLAQPAAAPAIADELRPLAAIAMLPTRRILETIFALLESGGRLDFEAVHARLTGEEQAVLAQAVLAEDGEITEEELAGALASIRRSEDELQRSELKKRIKEAERSGNLNEALRLADELHRVERNGRSRS
jgi:DNA primase